MKRVVSLRNVLIYQFSQYFYLDKLALKKNDLKQNI